MMGESFLNLYSSDNPNGVIMLAIAENKLCSSFILENIAQIFESSKDLPRNILNYTDPTGIPTLKLILAEFLSKYICKGLIY